MSAADRPRRLRRRGPASDRGGEGGALRGEPGTPALDDVPHPFGPHPRPAAAAVLGVVAHRVPAARHDRSARSNSSARPAGGIPYASSSSRSRAGTSTPACAGARSAGCCSGTHHIAVVSRSSARRVGRARSKSISATGNPPRKTTFCGVTSQCATSSGTPTTSTRSAGSSMAVCRPNQSSSGGGSQPAEASCSRRTSRPIPATTSSVQAHSSGGAPGTSPSTWSRMSRPRSSTPRKRGAPSKPTASRCRRYASTKADCACRGRRTVAPTRTTPSVTSPFGNATSRSSPPMALLPSAPARREAPASGRRPSGVRGRSPWARGVSGGRPPGQHEDDPCPRSPRAGVIVIGRSGGPGVAPG